uniref:Uncharacterized protein n=1 Tax=Timema tahoe TaxID=61484 RepID=A0A7R9IH38_9NEOP|nr:unnamed protein product [Timema tahoe]
MKVFNVLDEDSDDNLKQSSSEGRFHPRSSEATIAEVNEDEEGVEIPMGFEANRLVPPLGQFSHESPLLGYPGASKSLVRVSTYASSLNQPGTSRHDSTSGTKQGKTATSEYPTNAGQKKARYPHIGTIPTPTPPPWPDNMFPWPTAFLAASFHRALSKRTPLLIRENRRILAQTWSTGFYSRQG